MTTRVLIVDDSLYMRTVIKEALEENNYQIVGQAADGESAIDLALELQPDLITLDNILPDMLGLDIIRTLKEESVNARIIMISAVGQQSVINAGMGLGADHYIVKPFSSEQLLDAIQEVMTKNK
ncbi:MAG: response regulator [Bernardetiaceae bacterium]